MFLAVRTRRAAVILPVLVILSPAICGINSAKNLYAATTWTEKSDTDFSGGVISSVTIVGTGDAAYIGISSVQATGGTITYSGGYTIHTFTSNGTFTPNSAMNVEYLIVAGGGGGGMNAGAGGGAGGLLEGTTSIATQSYAVIVGSGGAGGTESTTGTRASNGTNSSALGIIAIGGGAGVNSGGTTGGDGGSGGGAGDDGTGNRAGGIGVAGPPRQGYNGGAGTIPGGPERTGGGGGGAGAAGQNSVSSSQAGNGGVGKQSAISGTSIYYAGGGGGGVHSGTGGSGGLGGGGGENIAGAANTGGGGGAARSGDGNGRDGGSGIVIVRYLSLTTGTYHSNVLDTASKIAVSSISWNPSSQPTGTNLAVSVRVSSYPFSINSSTPSWLTVTNGQSLNWHGRYIQYQSTFTTTNSTTTPRLEDISITYRVKPWQEKSVTRTPPNAFGFGGGENWTWQVPVKGGTLVTISAYIRYNVEYQGGTYDKSKLTLSGLGINESISATSSADNSWELRQLSGTPSADGILTLKAEGFSTNPGGKFYIDDINLSQ